MAYSKRRSTELEKAQARLRGLLSIQSELNLGNGLSLQDYDGLIQTTDRSLQTYNTSLSESDRTRLELIDIEAQLATLSSRILSAIAAMYGKNSKEYAMAGGKPSGGGKRKAAVVTAVVPSDANAAIDRMTLNRNGNTNGSVNGASQNGNVMTRS
jgi:hypothetical protein